MQRSTRPGTANKIPSASAILSKVVPGGSDGLLGCSSSVDYRFEAYFHSEVRPKYHSLVKSGGSGSRQMIGEHGISNNSSLLSLAAPRQLHRDLWMKFPFTDENQPRQPRHFSTRTDHLQATELST